MNVEGVDLCNGRLSQPNVCRCCLATSGVWDVNCTYISQTGDKEVYSEVLLECYGISLSYLTEWGTSHLMCASCVDQLRNANIFRKQVLKAEEQFFAFRRTDAVTIEGLKFEEEQNAVSDSKTCHQEMTDCLKPSNRKRHKISVKVKRKRRNTEEYDSDTPIAELSRKCELSGEGDKDYIIGNNRLTNDSQANADVVKADSYSALPNRLKPVSERKRVIVTCDTVLKESTACPFRHHKSWFRCFYCPQDFMTIDSLRHHTKDTHENVTDELKKLKRYPRSLQIDISNLECRQCHLNLTDVQSMCRHFVEVHGKVIYKECIADYKVNTSPFSCHLCDRQFHVFRTLTTHLNEHYANFICDVCGKPFIHSKRLKVHKRTHELGQYQCPHCDKVLKTKSSLSNHVETHSKRQIKCQICLQPMKHYNDRVKHMSEIHNVTHTFRCPICPRIYNIKHYLATHIRQTHGHKNKKCSVCGMAFITNHGLKKHMLKHSGQKPFNCRVCRKAFARGYTLKEHMRGHDSSFLTAE